MFICLLILFIASSGVIHYYISCIVSFGGGV